MSAEHIVRMMHPTYRSPPRRHEVAVERALIVIVGRTPDPPSDIPWKIQKEAHARDLEVWGLGYCRRVGGTIDERVQLFVDQLAGR